MIVYHATTRKAYRAILKSGCLDPAKSLGRLKAVWFHKASKTAWAVLHTIKRHGGSLDGIVVIELHVPRTWLRRSKKGLWYCTQAVPMVRAARTRGFLEVAA